MVKKLSKTDLNREDFHQNYYNQETKKPVLIKGEIEDWKATNKWNPEYLDCALGHQEVHIMFLEEGIYDINGPKEIEEKTLPFSEARNKICEDGRYYLAQATVDVPLLTKITTGSGGEFSRLSKDIHLPRFLNDFPKRWIVTNLWFGGDKCKTPLHYDDKENFFTQVFGEKRVLLFSPSQTEYLYQAHGQKHDHMSRVNVFNPNETEFPRYTNAESSEVIVEPGDMLYIPKGWWHAVEPLSTSISINYWWVKTIPYLKHELYLLYDRLDTVKS